MTKSQTIKNPKILIPSILGIAMLTVVLTMFTPISAIAQVSMPDSSANQMPVIAGSVNVDDAIKNYINENKKVSFAEAATSAEKQVQNGSVVGGRVGIEQGYLVYTFSVIDVTNNTVYNIIIDAGDGKVLYKSAGIPLESHGFGGHGMYGFGGHKMKLHQEFDESDMKEPSAQG
jgi:hypothetical protein